MTRIRSRSGSRAGFTMIELLIVIAIIAVLVSLSAAAVFKAFEKVHEVSTRTEISQLEAALQSFMTDYSLSDPPPSVLVLRANIAAYPPGDPSGTFLKRAFGKNLGTGVLISWDGNPAAVTVNSIWVLEGEQCLTFYTGGIGGTQGFSTNNINPSQLGGKRNGPYINFTASRMMAMTNKAGTIWPVYIDAWQSDNSPFSATLTGTPYAYFSSNGINNSGYLLNAGLDCVTISAAAYNDGAGHFTYPNKYQILSAGKDGVFGTGAWIAANGATDLHGKDDQANFSAKLLGAEQQ